jgi:hypothetical protein
MEAALYQATFATIQKCSLETETLCVQLSTVTIHFCNPLFADVVTIDTDKTAQETAFGQEGI